MKKILILAIITLFTAVGYMAADNMDEYRDEIWDIAKAYKFENTKRKMRLMPVVKVNVPDPVHRQSKKKAAAVIAEDKGSIENKLPVVYDFTNSTAWGTFTVRVIETAGENSFKVSFESPYPVQNLEIIDSTTKIKVITVNLNDINKYTVQVNYAFKPVYVLILKANINDEIQPQIIPLYKNVNVKTK
jgi:hypothetical protein